MHIIVRDIPSDLIGSRIVPNEHVNICWLEDAHSLANGEIGQVRACADDIDLNENFLDFFQSYDKMMDYFIIKDMKWIFDRVRSDKLCIDNIPCVESQAKCTLTWKNSGKDHESDIFTKFYFECK